MRIVTSAHSNAIVSPNGYKPLAKLTVYKSRVFFKDVDIVDTYAPSFAHPVDDTDYPLPEASAYNSTLGRVVTVMVSPNGLLYLAIDGEAPVNILLPGSLPSTSSTRSRPGIIDDIVYYHDTTEWRKITFSPALLDAGTQLCVLTEAAYSTITEDAAAYPVSATETAFLYIDDGAVRPMFVASDASEHVGLGRFFAPTKAMITTDDYDAFSLHFGGAAKLNGNVYFYYTMSTGAVNGVKFQLNSAETNGIWSDFFTAVPSDLSTTEIGNVFSANNKIFIAARFKRNEEFASTSRYTLLTYSIDGVTFSLDRRILVSLVALRFKAVFDGADITFTSSNRSYSEAAHYQLLGTSTRKTEIDVKSVAGSEAKSTAKIKAGNEEYIDNPDVKQGSYARLEFGAVVSGGLTEWVVYNEMVIESAAPGFQDGDRTFSVVLVPDGIWHTSIMSHPFYMEFQGKQSVYDECNALENLDDLSAGIGTPWSLTVDMWQGQTAHQGGSHEGSETDDVFSSDLKTFYDDYPVFGDGIEYTMSIYGWSRAGRESTNPNTDDDTPTTTNNDDFYGLVEVEYPDGIVEVLVTDIVNLTSTYSNPPQTYFTDGIREGSYPVEFTIDNPGEDTKILRVGVRIVSDTGNTVFNIERVEMPGIIAFVPATTVLDAVVDNSPWALVDEITLQITTSNDADGNLTNGSYNTKIGYCYAVVIVGEVSFTRDALTQYVQDAEFVGYSALVDERPPTWVRAYPPGVGIIQNQSVEITAGLNPYNGSGQIVIQDSIPTGLRASPVHKYLFHSDESAYLDNSSILAKHVPYLHGSGAPYKVALYLDGTGVISDIEEGEFKIYVFESPVKYEDFIGYGGDTTIDGEVVKEVAHTNLCGTSINIVGSTGSYTLDRINIYDSCVDLVEKDSSGFYDILGYATVSYTTGGIHPAPDGSFTFKIYQVKFQAGNNPTTVLLEEVIPFSIGINETFSYTFTFDVSTLDSTLYNAIFVECGIVGSGSSAATSDMSRNYLVTPFGVPENPQVPVPPSFIFIVPGFGSNDDPGSIINTKKGTPNILFSSTPYSAWNFEATGRYRMAGEYSSAGVLGLAEDNQNYLVGYIKAGYAGVAVARGGVLTVLNEQVVSDIEEGKSYDVRVWHRDGLIGIEVKRLQDVWPVRGSLYTYEWRYTDGSIATNDDFFHVGAWSFINPPHFRTVGYVSGQAKMGVLPLDLNPDTNESDFDELFPPSGNIDIGGSVYSYGAKFTQVSPMGPFQLRNQGTSNLPFSKDLEDGYEFPGGAKLEILQFKWWDGTTYAKHFENVVMASDAGYAWLVKETQWKVWITTNGQVVYLINRAKHYTEGMTNYYGSGSERIWLPSALVDLSGENTSSIKYPEGTFVYLDSGDEIELLGFIAVSGKRDNSVASLLDILCKVAGSDSEFPGDNVIDAVVLNEGEEQEI